MKALRQQIALTAPTNGRVLIYGESGTGKEPCRSRASRQQRAPRPPIRRSELRRNSRRIDRIRRWFGLRKGSFAGASEDKVGKFEKADGGTLFLDEVGDMSLKTQSKVLRLLDENRVEPLGSNRPCESGRAALIAATNKKLDEEITRNASAKIFSIAST